MVLWTSFSSFMVYWLLWTCVCHIPLVYSLWILFSFLWWIFGWTLKGFGSEDCWVSCGARESLRGLQEEKEIVEAANLQLERDRRAAAKECSLFEKEGGQLDKNNLELNNKIVGLIERSGSTGVITAIESTVWRMCVVVWMFVHLIIWELAFVQRILTRTCLPIDSRSDIYNLGATFYHLFMGQPSFTGTTPEIIFSYLSMDPIAISNEGINLIIKAHDE